MDLSKFTMTFSPEFIELYNQTDARMLDLEGIAPGHLDMAHMTTCTKTSALLTCQLMIMPMQMNRKHMAAICVKFLKAGTNC